MPIIKLPLFCYKSTMGRINWSCTHCTQLMGLVQASNNTSSLCVTCDAGEKHPRSLQSLVEDIQHRQTISIIRTKLPKVVIARLKQQKDPNEEWILETLKKALKNYISNQEVGGTQVHQQEQLKFSTTKGLKFYKNKNFQLKERPTFGQATVTLLSGKIKPTFITAKSKITTAACAQRNSERIYVNRVLAPCCHVERRSSANIQLRSIEQ